MVKKIGFLLDFGCCAACRGRNYDKIRETLHFRYRFKGVIILWMLAVMLSR
jgi:hypothetical protein